MKDIYRQIKVLEKAAAGNIPVALVELRDGLWESVLHIDRQGARIVKRDKHASLEDAVAHIRSKAKQYHCRENFPIIIDDIPEV